jgi:hypothetical protein
MKREMEFGDAEVAEKFWAMRTLLGAVQCAAGEV